MNVEKEKLTTDQVIVQMSEQKTNQPNQTVDTDQLKPPSSPPVHEIQQKQNPTRAISLRTIGRSKSKFRFAETNHPLSRNSTGEFVEPGKDDGHTSSDEDDDEGDVAEGTIQDNTTNKKKRKIKWRALIEWVSFFVILTGLVCSLTVEPFKNQVKWGLKVWKWWLMFMVIICGRLVAGWVVALLVFFIERNFMLKEKVLYFVFGLRKSFRNFFWLALALLAWTCILNPELQNNNKYLKKVFRALVAVLIGTAIWLVKIVLVKLLATSFYVAKFFDRMKVSAFHHYVLENLSGPPLSDGQKTSDHPLPADNRKNMKLVKSLPARLRGSEESVSGRIDMETLERALESTKSAWSVKRLVRYVRSSCLSTISRDKDELGRAESEITSKSQAKVCANRTFKKVAKENSDYIEVADLSRFLEKEVIDTLLQLFDGAVEENGKVKISKSCFRKWAVRAYEERKKLRHSLTDTRTAVQQLHKLASAVVIVIIFIMSVLVTGIATTKVIFVVTSQLLLVGFMFKNTCRTIFESIVFVFVVHPFDAGDRCVIDGVMMVVEEMNILTTTFLRYDREMIYYPNSVLLAKPISNFGRSPNMNDTLEFTIDFSTPIQKIEEFKAAIKTYIEKSRQHWDAKHSVIVKEIENVDKMKMSLVVLHTMNYQDIVERNKRRTKLVLKLKSIFEDLGIKYHLLPQQVILTKNM